jgi:aspartate 1-decarboxylase
MQRTMFKSKIHRATLTGTKLNYEGSICIDEALMEAADLLPAEQVDVLNCNNGERLTTYVIKGKRNSGTVELRGPAARLGYEGDPVIIVSYATYEDADARKHKPVIVRVDGKNHITR